MRDGLIAPISFDLQLRDNGLSLTAAHDAATKLAADGSLTVTLHPRSVRELETLGLAARVAQTAGLKSEPF